MNAVEKLLLEFAKKELMNNPQLAGSFLKRLLEQYKVDPTLANDIVQLFDELLPMILSNLK